MLARIRDEAHRFANTFHRERRSKQSLRSELDDIPGIGESRRKRLLKHFGSVRAIRLASTADLAKAPGMTRAAAAAVGSYFAQREAAERTADSENHVVTAEEAEIDRDFDANVEGRGSEVEIEVEESA